MASAWKKTDEPKEGNGNQLQYSWLENPTDGSLAGYSPWRCKELDMTEQLSRAHRKNMEVGKLLLTVESVNKYKIKI